MRAAWTSIVDQALQAVRRAYAGPHVATLRLHGDCHGGNVLVDRRRAAFRRLRRRAQRARRAGPVDAAVRRARRDGGAAARSLLGGYESFRDFDRRELALIEPLRTLRLLHYSRVARAPLERSGVSRRLSVVQHAALLAGPDPRAARAGRADGRAAAARLTHLSTGAGVRLHRSSDATLFSLRAPQ